LKKFYGVEGWDGAEDFIRRVAIKKGKLRKGGEPDLEATSKLVLIDWQRGELPYYSLPEGEVDIKMKMNEN
jgi:ribosome biogenesis GTPase A